jgi:hypothetical protein
MLGEAIRSIGLAFVALLVLAVTHKVRVLIRRQAAAEPLIKRGRWRSGHPNAALALAAGLETAIAIAIVVSPTIGLFGLAGLTLGYSFELQKLPAAEPCNCFGGALRSPSRKAATVRNLAICCLAAAAAAVSLVGDQGVAPISSTTLGVALLIVAGFASLDLLRHIPRAAPRQPSSVEGNA